MAVTQDPQNLHPAELLQNLIRFDTTNPPGNERVCMEYIQSILHAAGIESQMIGKDPQRPNLLARMRGEGKAPPLLLYTHLDVVTTENQAWTYPPFEGRLVDGVIWGRGAIDNKHSAAMYLCALIAAKHHQHRLPGDVIFAACADEEAGGEFGARYLVERYPDLFTGVRFALSEFGGFNIRFAGKKAYPIQVAEKQTCLLKLRFHGQGGHGSMPVRAGAMAKLGRALQVLDRKLLPVHITAPVRTMFESISEVVGGINGSMLRLLLSPALTDTLLMALGDKASQFSPLLHNSVSPTMVDASNKFNVIPSEVSLGLDGRILPGFSPDTFTQEIRSLLGADFDLEVMDYQPGPTNLNMDLFPTLSEVLKTADPSGHPVPLVGSWITDARFFSRLGIQTYGFTPLQVPDDFDLSKLSHAADERVPVKALEFGVRCVSEVLQRFI
jgi:acetylornithine deacetylase/succinyl-diaminopimelate desuccinylase-like protein